MEKLISAQEIQSIEMKTNDLVANQTLTLIFHEKLPENFFTVFLFLLVFLSKLTWEGRNFF